MNVVAHSHRGGQDAVPQRLQRDLTERLSSIAVPMRRGALVTIRSEIRSVCTDLGFSEAVRLHRESQMSVTGAMNSTALCLQTGNVARVYADLLKLQLLYSRGDISAAIMVVLMNGSAREFGQNIANFERLVRELAIFSELITTPILVFGLGG